MSMFKTKIDGNEMMAVSSRRGKEDFEAQYPAQDAQVCATVGGNCN